MCKYIVAVGLAILDGYFDWEVDDYEDAIVVEENEVSSADFSLLFD